MIKDGGHEIGYDFIHYVMISRQIGPCPLPAARVTAISQLERAIQTQCGIKTLEIKPNTFLYVSVKSTAVSSVLLVYLASHTG